MSRTCESCGRSWRGSATFCGRCGDLLPDALGATVARRPGDAGTTPHGRLLVVVLGLVVLGGAATVPSLSIERTPPVTGDIGVPETDDLQAAPAQATRRRSVPAPEVSCSRDGVPVDCLLWQRDLLGPAATDGSQGWPLASGGYILLSGPDGAEGVDARTGTRLWRHGSPTHAFPRDAGGGLALIEGPGGVDVIDLATGDARWRSPDASVGVDGDVLHQDVVLTGDTDAPGAVVARELDDGTPRWRWTAPWPWVQALGVVGDRLLLVPGQGSPGLAILDLPTGQPIATSQVPTSWWVVGAVGDTLVLAEPIEGDMEGGNPAGDGGAVLRGVSLEDAEMQWERPVPAGQVMFGLVEGIVLAPSTGTVTAVDARTGEVAWTRELDPWEELAYHGHGGLGPTADLDHVPRVVAVADRREGVVRAHDPATGDVRWERPLDDELMHLGVDAQVVWVILHDGFMLLDPGTGRERVRVHGAQANPFSLDPLLLFHHDSGVVARIDPDAEELR